MKEYYLIVFRTVTNFLTPWFLRTADYLRYKYSIIKPLQDLNNDGIVVRDFGEANPSMYQHHRMLSRFGKFGAARQELEKWLNLYWDDPDERIVIVNNNTAPITYLFNTAEEANDVFFFNQWDSGVTYHNSSIEDYVHFANRIYVSLVLNTNKQPDLFPAGWSQFSQPIFFFNDGEPAAADFIVEVPLFVSLQPDYSTEKITEQINLFNAAGRTFVIVIV